MQSPDGTGCNDITAVCNNISAVVLHPRLKRVVVMYIETRAIFI